MWRTTLEDFGADGETRTSDPWVPNRRLGAPSDSMLGPPAVMTGVPLRLAVSIWPNRSPVDYGVAGNVAADSSRTAKQFLSGIGRTKLPAPTN